MPKTKPVAAGGAEKKKSKGKKKGKHAPVKVAMKARGAAAAEKSNPFEAIWSRRKFDVLGKKRKGEEQRISRARSEAIRKVGPPSLVTAVPEA
jgi:nucleolar protein 14